jgi:hypothetical protein
MRSRGPDWQPASAQGRIGDYASKVAGIPFVPERFGGEAHSEVSGRSFVDGCRHSSAMAVGSLHPHD